MVNITVFCFLASYLVASVLEVIRLRGKSVINLWMMKGFAAAGLVAHTWYLINRAQQTNLPPLLSSTHDWLLVLAWLAMGKIFPWLFRLVLEIAHPGTHWS